jgi:hypothetical protein
MRKIPIDWNGIEVTCDNDPVTSIAMIGCNNRVSNPSDI